jgi:hypothetical protein
MFSLLVPFYNFVTSDRSLTSGAIKLFLNPRVAFRVHLMKRDMLSSRGREKPDGN